MSLLNEINEAANDFIPQPEPVVEMHPMTKMMLKAMGDEDPEEKYEKPKKEKKKKKKLSDYLSMKNKSKK